jgi:hypothetical protein
MTLLSPAVQLVAGATTVSPWRRLAALPLVILVGVTGVGKSTTLAALKSADVPFDLLPDRRFITDKVMIEPLVGQSVSDRAERFALTARYRELHPGGMAHALGMIAVDRTAMPNHLFFDGLRGLEEVHHAALHFPNARFLLLDAPDSVRVQRLIGRGDAFDRVNLETTPEPDLLRRLNKIIGVQEVFSENEIKLLALLEGAETPASEIISKVKIVMSERNNYDPVAARGFLAQLPKQRALIVDTVAHDSNSTVRLVQQWL